MHVSMKRAIETHSLATVADYENLRYALPGGPVVRAIPNEDFSLDVLYHRSHRRRIPKLIKELQLVNVCYRYKQVSHKKLKGD